ncbi:hypothetical protein COCON_G00116700 [Conger conger]|uniref:VWFD domain-containing protein n=1 Tax=Conger conger TaxID=82655 RepID=A0A9Q1HWK7_CONCO|nr:hypothetical protein COCON_G00116700 [Conger conger]
MKIQVQVKPKVQLYVTLPESESGNVKGLCGNHNDETKDDFIGKSGINENVAEYFALSWVVGQCNGKTPEICSSDVEKYAHEDCSHLTDRSGIFAGCHNQDDCGSGHKTFSIRAESVPCCEEKLTCSRRIILELQGKNTLKLQDLEVEQMGNDTEPLYSVQTIGLYFVISVPSLEITLIWDKHTRLIINLGGRWKNKVCGLCGNFNNNEEDDLQIRGSMEKADAITSGNSWKMPVPQCSDVVEVQFSCDHFSYCTNWAERRCMIISSDTFKACHQKVDYVPYYEACVKEACSCSVGSHGFCTAVAAFAEACCEEGISVKWRTPERCRTTCKGGHWDCVEKDCPGECQVFGNGHYQTFDSKWYRFDGNCEYTLVEDDCGSGHQTFSIRTESVPCCEEKLTCSRRIILELQGKNTLKLQDLEVEQMGNDTEPLYSVQTIGLYFVISVPSLEITLIWDKHTRLIINLGGRWKNKVCGLCGNFNNNEEDDLQIRGSMEKADAITSGNSWKMPVPQCSDVVEVQFSCDHFSYCTNWAERRCLIISSDIFKACHQKVDYVPYYEACVKEACSCSVGSHGFCTAVAAFAEACCEEGISVKWRTPERCPVYCDYYNEQNPQSSDATWHYKPCGTQDIKTCSKSNVSRKLEGCYPECPEDFPYFDENTKKCSKS